MSGGVSQKRSESGRAGRLIRELRLINQYGIHARPAALFVKTAQRFDANVTVEKDGMAVSGKSIMGLMTLEAGFGVKLRVSAEGPQAEQALDELEALVDGKFGEE